MEEAIGVQYRLINYTVVFCAILFDTSCPFEKWVQLKSVDPILGSCLKILPPIAEYFF